MIYLTRLNESKVVINSDLIEFIEAIPDTIITLTTGQKIMVKETVEDVVNKVVTYKRKLLSFPIDERVSKTE
jgi:flagellar protein FlbD